MMMKLSWKAASMERLFKSTFNWQTMKWVYLDLRARMYLGFVGYLMISRASSKGLNVVGTIGQCDSCIGWYGFHSARSHV